VGDSRDSPASVVEYVIKVASRCNLACDHCYVYDDPDRGWLAKPVMMDPATARAAARRIAQHAERHGLVRVAVILHGGEPLLLGAARLERLLGELRAVIEPVVELDLRIQSNGVRLTREIADVLADQHVTVGISLDGDRIANDRHRIYVNGASSHGQVLRALALLRTPPYRSLYGGLLCTIDVDNDPVRVYEALLREEPPRIDFLLPHATWEKPPPGRRPGRHRYAEWLLAIHDRWLADGRPVPIRLFDSISTLGRGGPSGTESLGADTGAVAVIETDGTWERVDSLKTVSEDAVRTGLDVHRNSVDEFGALAVDRSRHEGRTAPECRGCRVFDTCGGGLYAHRFGRGNGFANPSVYCEDLLDLITTVQRREPEGRGVPAAPPLAARLGWVAHVPRDTLQDLASGSPTPESLGRLALAEYAIDRTLVARVAGAATDRVGGAGRDVLAELDDRWPAAVREVVSHPFVRARVRRCLVSGARAGAFAAGAGLLTSLAAAAAVRAGHPVSLDVRVDRGAFSLPGIGTLALPEAERAVFSTGDTPGTFVVRPDRGDPRHVTLDAAGDQPGWAPVRTVGTGPLAIRLDDADPDRDCFPHPVTDALTAAEAERWSAALAAALAAVRSDAPELAAPLDALITTVTPTRPVPGGRPPTAMTTRTAFGAVAMPLAPPRLLGSMLVEQAAKLTVVAVHEMVPLYDSGPDAPRGTARRDGSRGRRTGRTCADRLADASARTASLQLMTARMRAGRAVDRAAVRTVRDSLRHRLDSLDRASRWTDSGRVVLAGLRGRLDQLATA
jgi:uncharacterized protein